MKAFFAGSGEDPEPVPPGRCAVMPVLGIVNLSAIKGKAPNAVENRAGAKRDIGVKTVKKVLRHFPGDTEVKGAGESAVASGAVFIGIEAVKVIAGFAVNCNREVVNCVWTGGDGNLNPVCKIS